MDRVTRTGISIDPKILKAFDSFIKRKGYSNRSEAIQDILREHLFHKKDAHMISMITVIYDHRLGHYNNEITKLQHEYHCMVLFSNRNYMDHHNCMELIFVKGKKERIDKFVNKLKSLKGVKKVEIKNF